MQVQKQEIRKNIVDAAKREFAENGFEDASVRTITAKAKTSKSNIYNYFNDKDSLFAAVVEPGIRAMDEVLLQLRQMNISSGNAIAAHRLAMARLMDCIYSNQDSFRLLFFKSSGSRLISYRDTTTDTLAGILYSWAALYKADKSPSEFFIRSIASFYIEVLEQMLSHGLSHEQAAVHLYEFLKFLYGGWNEVLL